MCAAVRAGRFDRILRLEPPDVAGRIAILRRYLRGLDAEIDVERVARATDGATGAALRELLTRAVLEAGEHVSTAVVLRVARDLQRSPTGQYL